MLITGTHNPFSLPHPFHPFLTFSPRNRQHVVNGICAQLDNFSKLCYLFFFFFPIMDFSFKLGGKEKISPMVWVCESATSALKLKEGVSIPPWLYHGPSTLQSCSAACRHTLGRTKEKHDSMSPGGLSSIAVEDECVGGCAGGGQGRRGLGYFFASLS